MYKNVVLLCGKGESSNMLYHHLCKNGIFPTVIVEQKIKRSIWLSKRIKKLGWTQVLGQLLFLVVVLPFINQWSRKRKKQIIHLYGLDNSIINNEIIIETDSVNSDQCIKTLKTIAPDLVIVNGTRIISRKVLEAINCSFINIHAGITPYYRGVHGAYWALVNNDISKCGVTVHLVDKGIDTGGVLAQANIEMNTADNFSTYPLLQLTAGLKLLLPTLDALSNQTLVASKSSEKGQLYYHPTLWEYCYYLIKSGIK